MAKRTCSSCNEKKNIFSFYFLNKKNNTKMTICKKCDSIRKKNRYVKERNEIIKKVCIYSKNNRKKINENRKKIRNIPKNRLNHNFSNLMLYHLKNMKNGQHWENIVGYTLNELIEHLENTSDFTIQDYLEKDLHIDHIIPRSLYKFESHEDEKFKKCWNYRNLRFLEGKENMQKNNKLDLKLIKKYGIDNLLPKEVNNA